MGLALLGALAGCGPVEPTGEGFVSVRVEVTGPGSVYSLWRGGFPCSDECNWTLNEGMTTLEPWPTGDNAFVEWGGVCDPFPTSCSRAFSDGDVITATFAANALRLDLTGDGEGRFEVRGGVISEDCVADCAIAVPDNSRLLSITYVGDTNRNDLGAPWGGACEDSNFDDYCQVNVSGQADVSKTWLHPPIADGDAYGTMRGSTLSVDAASGVLINDDDTPGDPLRAQLVSGADVTNGTLTLRPDGSFDYQPDPGWSGVDAFRYAVIDGFGNRDVADVTITVANALLTLAKSGGFQDEDGDTFADVGETIDYTFVITNDGNVTLTTITLTDPLITDNAGTITFTGGDTDADEQLDLE